MRIKKSAGLKKLLAIVLGLSLLICAIGGTVFAAGEIEKVSLTVNPSDNFADEDAEKDFNEAKVVLDLYQIASAEKNTESDTYDFSVLPAFEDLSISDEMDAQSWQTAAADAAAIVKESGKPVVTGAALGEKIESTDDGEALPFGWYLVIARGEEEEDYWSKNSAETVANSSKYEYRFSPILVSLPTKEDVDGDGSRKTSVEDGDWIGDVELTLKYTQSESYGSLTIFKRVDNFEGEMATFVFSVEAVKGGNVVYSNVATIHMGQSGVQSATLDRIPAGATVTIREEYKGGRFDSVGSDEITIESFEASEDNEATFVNTYNRKLIGGHGIQNHFTYTKAADGTVSVSHEQQ